MGGILIVNADDWGRDRFNTDRILECSARGTISSVSAMVFMEDSERAAALVLEHGLSVGLHLNFTSAFTSDGCTAGLQERLGSAARHLLRHRFAPAVFHPGLMGKFEYLVSAQIDEFRRLYGSEPDRIDGHHHMHLCPNVLMQKLLPAGTLVRRHFSFEKGEKSVWNRRYRRFWDRMLARRHQLFDYFFSLPPMLPERMERIYRLALNSWVEVETHPVNDREHKYLTSGQMLGDIGDAWIAAPADLRRGGALAEAMQK